jgi:hypothetical protein
MYYKPVESMAVIVCRRYSPQLHVFHQKRQKRAATKQRYRYVVLRVTPTSVTCSFVSLLSDRRKEGRRAAHSSKARVGFWIPPLTPVW